MNTYVPKFVPDNLPWYERDGLITWYDQQKCEDFLRDNDKHFKETKIIKFNIIYREICGEVVPPNFFKFYQTVNEKTISQYPSSEKDNICSSAFRTDRIDIYFEKKPLKNASTTKEIKNQKLFFFETLFIILNFLSILILLLIY